MQNANQITKKILFSKAHGNASKNATRAILTLPKDELLKLGIDEENREVNIEFKDDKIIIKRLGL